MDDAPRVQGLQRRQHPQRDPERLSDRNALAGETLLECLALQQLHDEVELPTLFSELVDVADVRMVDACCGPGLAQQTLAQCRVSGSIRIRLMATSRSRRSSWAAYTTPMPPWPSRRVTR